MTWTVGQSVWVVPGKHGGRPYASTIVKIGRKWATLEGWSKSRFGVETGAMDGGDYSSPGDVFACEQDYLDERGRNERWGVLIRNMQYRWRPRHLSDEDLAVLERLLLKDPTP